jgi:CheY-like chemotaxis protein
MTNRKILIVDDDPDVRLAMQVRLNANGYETFFAVDALSSITEAHRRLPDLILLDLGLPAGDGFVVMDRLKTHSTLAAIPIVVVSGRDARANAGRAVKAGAKGFLQKPVDNAELLGVIRHALGDPAEPGDAAAYEL